MLLVTACGLLPIAPVARAETPVGLEASLIYLDADEWAKQPTARKVDLAADFMRIFCTDQTMSPATLADCLDHDRTTGPLLDRAIACVSAISGRHAP